MTVKLAIGFFLEEPIGTFPRNEVVTSKYTVLNFVPQLSALLNALAEVPKNIWEQLHKAANSYFLLISLIMFIGRLRHLSFHAVARELHPLVPRLHPVL